MRKKTPVQLAIPGTLEVRPRSSALSLTIDFAAMPVGQLIADERVAVECPVCGRVCLPERKSAVWRFAHTGTVSSNVKTTKYAPLVYCELEREVFDALVRRESVLITLQGSIKRTLPHAQAMVIDERDRREAARKARGG